MMKKYFFLLSMFCFTLLQSALPQNLISNGNFETGTGAACACAASYSCGNDAGRVVDGVHPVFVVGNQGCIGGSTNYASSLGAHGGTGYMYFYAGADNFFSSAVNFTVSTQVEMCIWYSGPQGSGGSGQNTANAHFKLAVDGTAVGPNVLVPVNTGWTHHCHTTTVNPGSHTFGVLSGGAAVYSIWFDDFTVMAPSALPSVNLGNDTLLCPGESLTLNATNPSASYLWQDNSTNSTFTISQAGTYWVAVTNMAGTVYDTIVVGYYLSPYVFLGNDTSLCQGSPLLLDATLPNAFYLWNDNSQNSTLTVTQTGAYWVSVMVNGCSSSDTINVTYIPLPFADLGNDTALCEGNVMMLDATAAGASYLWNDLSSTSSLQVSQQGVYWVSVTVNGCTAVDSVTVSFNPVPLVDLGNDTTLCEGSLLILDAGNPGAGYFWQNASTGQTCNVYSPGLYWVEVNLAGCIAYDTIMVNFQPRPNVNLGDDVILCQGTSMELDASLPGATYLWNDGSDDATLAVFTEGTYWVIVGTNGCYNSDTIRITESLCNILLYIPNIFTPNGDGQNDILFVRGAGISELLFVIYDRWGEKVFTSTDIGSGWDGTFRSKTCDLAVYAYFVKVTFVDGKKETRKGTVSLVR